MSAIPTTRDERGAALVLVIAFMVVIGLLTSALLGSLISAVDDRAVLDSVRDRQYAADAAVEGAIARVRGLPPQGPALHTCDGPDLPSQLNGVLIRVDCTNVPIEGFNGGGFFVQRNVIFTSCLNTGVACTNATTIVRAQVNYEALDAETPTVTKTYVQSWSVNG